MRLFTALWPPEEATAALAACIGAAAPTADPAGEPPAAGGPGAIRWPPPGWRAVEPSTWHVTLAFHGEADPGVLARRLESDVRGLPAPRLRLAGAGEFPGVRWVGVESDGPLSELAAAVRRMLPDAGTAPFVPHLTVARRARRGAAAGPEKPAWRAHRGPWWTPAEAVLVVSEAGRRGPRYRPVHRVPLTPPGWADRARQGPDRAW